MKRNIFAILFAVIMFSSCAEKLNIYPHSAISPDGVTSADIPALRNGVYSAMQTKLGVTGYICFDVLGGDLTQKNYNPIDVYNNYMKTLGSNVSNQWNSLYNQLYHVNSLIAAIDRAGIEGNEVYYGEAHYFRAMIYINLITRWGGVPVLAKNTMDKVARNTKAETWAFINENLETAMEYLKTSDSYYMVSLDAAKALAARAYLYQGNKIKAAELAEELITSGKYALESDFNKIFGYQRLSNKETIFAFYMDDTEGGLTIGSQYFTYAYENKGSGNYFPTSSFEKLFDDMDKRKAITFVTVGTDKCLGKYPGSQAHADPVIISRIGEIYLISAEAQGFPDGCARLNELRAVRGLGDAVVASQADLDEAVLLERRFELCGENLIWYDYIRMNKAIEKLGITKTQMLFPIPEGEIRENELLLQNPGWGGNEIKSE